MIIYLIYTRDTRKVLAYFTSEDECLSSYNDEYDSNKTDWIALSLDFLLSLFLNQSPDELFLDL